MWNSLIGITLLTTLIVSCSSPKEESNEAPAITSETADTIVTDLENESPIEYEAGPLRVETHGLYMTVLGGQERFLQLETREDKTRVWTSWSEIDTTKHVLRIGSNDDYETVYSHNDPEFAKIFTQIKNCSFHLGYLEGEGQFYYRVCDDCPENPFDISKRKPYDPIEKR